MMDRTLALMMVAALAFTLTACGDEEGGGVVPTVDTGQQDTGQDVGVDADEPDVGPDAAEDTGPDAEEDMGMDAGPPPIDLTGTWSVVRTDDALDVATLVFEQDGQFIDGTVMMADNEVYGGKVGTIGSVFIDEVERTVAINWVLEDDPGQHLLLDMDYDPVEMMTKYSNPDAVQVDVTVTRQ
jgi:hypothetical protein